MKKEINVTQVTDEVTNENLQIEEEIEFNNWKENLVGYAKVIWILFWVWVLIYVLIWVSVKPTTIDDIRVENLRKATEYTKYFSWEIIKRKEALRIAEVEYEKWLWCKNSNSIKWEAKDCFIFHNK